MGVKGLKSFLENNIDLLSTSIELRNTQLVLDANNVLLELFAKANQDKNSESYKSNIYGANLVAYGEVVRRFFTHLRRCKIEPLLVVDGCPTPRKEITKEEAERREAEYTNAILEQKEEQEAQEAMAERERERLERERLERGDRSSPPSHACFIAIAQTQSDTTASKARTLSGRSSQQLRGIDAMNEFSMTRQSIIRYDMIRHVFFDKAKEGGFKIIPTVYDADQEMAHMANELNCPVLTNDSDFMIFDLKRGFILMDLFDAGNQGFDRESESFTIRCQVFSQTRITRLLTGLDKRTIPLLSVLVGNDYIQARNFDYVVRQLCSGPYRGPLKTRNNVSHKQIAKLLEWMRDKTLKQCVNLILELAGRSTDRLELFKSIASILKCYNTKERYNFHSEIEKALPSITNGFVTVNPAAYLKRIMAYGSHMQLVLDLIFSTDHVTELGAGVLGQKSPLYVKSRPISLALVLLRPNVLLGMNESLKKWEAHKYQHYMHDLIDGQLVKVVSEQIDFLTGFGSLTLLNCYTIIMMDAKEKRIMAMACFHTDAGEMNKMRQALAPVFRDDFLSEAVVCFTLVRYIRNETGKIPAMAFVNALLLSIFHYAHLRGRLSYEMRRVDFYYLDWFTRLNATFSKHRTTKSNYKQITHSIRELVSAYEGYSLINTLLDSPIHSFSMGKFFNSTLIFNLTRIFRAKKFAMRVMCGDVHQLVRCSAKIHELCSSLHKAKYPLYPHFAPGWVPPLEGEAL